MQQRIAQELHHGIEDAFPNAKIGPQAMVGMSVGSKVHAKRVTIMPKDC